jgi:hypothetical protein
MQFSKGRWRADRQSIILSLPIVNQSLYFVSISLDSLRWIRLIRRLAVHRDKPDQLSYGLI